MPPKATTPSHGGEHKTIGGFGAVWLERMARIHGHRPGSVLRYAQQSFGVSRLAEVPARDMPDIAFFAGNPPKEMIQKQPGRGRREAVRDRRARIRRRVDRLLDPEFKMFESS